MSERYVTVPRAAEVLGLRRSRMWELAARGLVPAIRSGRRYLIDLEALEQLSREQAAARRVAHGEDR